MTTVKKAKLYIFDMDGTILDSMPAWEHLGRNYLISQNITPPDDLEDLMESMTLNESAVLFQSLGLHKKTDDIIHGVMSYIREQYRLSISAKPDMQSFVRELSDSGNTLCVLTTSEKDCVISSFSRLNILSCFDKVFTCEDFDLSKRNGLIYQKVCAYYHVTPSEAVVFEDALYAVRSAVDAGCYVYAVPDPSSKKDWEQIVMTAQDTLVFHP